MRGLKLILLIARTPPLTSILSQTETNPELDQELHLLSDEALEEEVRKRLETLYHPACSARMAPRDDGGVVDPMLRVYGVAGLRIADASVFPNITGGHTVCAATENIAVS